MSALLEISNLNAAYGASHVLHDLSMVVNQGEVVILLGRNGAGKTTVMRTIMGLTDVLNGTIRFAGKTITSAEPHRIAQAGIGLVPDTRRIFGALSVAENLELGRKPGTGEQSPWTLPRVFDLFPALQNLADRKGANLSGGQQQMLAIARTLLGNPTLLLLDEPGEGLAPVVVEELAHQLARLRDAGLSMVISEQNLSFTGGLGDRAYVLETGSIRHTGSLADLSADTAWTRFVAF